MKCLFKFVNLCFIVSTIGFFSFVIWKFTSWQYISVILLLLQEEQITVSQSPISECNRITYTWADDYSELGFGSIITNILVFGLIAYQEHRALIWDPNDMDFAQGDFTDFFLPNFHNGSYQCDHYNARITSKEIDDRTNLWFQSAELSDIPQLKHDPSCRYCIVDGLKPISHSNIKSWHKNDPMHDMNNNRSIYMKMANSYDMSMERFAGDPEMMHTIRNVTVLNYHRRRWLSYLLQPNHERKSNALRFIRHHDLFQRKFIAMHIRKGDKIPNEMKPIPLTNYITAIKHQIDMDTTYLNSPSKTCKDETLVPTIVFFSDEMSIYSEIMALQPCWNWLPLLAPPSDIKNNGQLLQQWTHQHGHINSQQWARLSQEERRKQSIEFFEALLIASLSNFLIMTRTSNIGRLLELVRGFNENTLSLDEYVLGI